MTTSMKVGERRVPLRTCVACGKKTTKTELMRIVSTPQGTLEIDTRGHLPGRGAYVCTDGECSRESLKKGRLEYALRRGLNDDEWAGVRSLIDAMAVRE